MPSLAEFISENPDLQKELDDYVNKEKSGVAAKNAEVITKLQAATQQNNEFKKTLEELGDIEGLKKIKTMFEQSEEMKLIAEGKHDEAFAKRTEKLKDEHVRQLSEISAKAEQSEQRSKAFEARVLESKVMNAALQVTSLNPAYMEDILLHARNKFSLNDDGEAVVIQDGQIVLGKDGKTPYTPNEWLSDKDATGRWHKAEGGAGAHGSTNSRPDKNTVTRTQFDSMSQLDRSNFAKNGGKVTD